MKPLKIWSNQQFPHDLVRQIEQGVAPHTMAWSQSKSESVLTAGGPDPAAREAEILYGQPDPQDVLASSSVRWVQLTSAGYTRYDDPAFLDNLRKRGIAFCNASPVFDEPCAQHAMAMLMSLARGLPATWADQPAHRWDTPPHRRRCFLLDRQKVLLVGYGAIARRLAELLSPYRMDVLAFRRNVRGDENVRTLPIEQIDQHLPTADIVFNILPASSSTRLFFNAERFSALKPGAVYLSIGRGDTTDQPALIQTLQSGQLGYAYLDVTTPEPLPPDNPLWDAPRCYITPHTAGGTSDEMQRLADAFLANLKRFNESAPLLGRIV
ncbi:MAG: D-2-hydroxyacid dehydrogenase [Tepidisphaeraceae bacterium]